MPDILPFQQAIIENAIQQDALNIIAPGLGMYQIIAILLRVQDERRKLPGETGVTLVIGANVSQRVVLQKELDRIHPISNRYETSEEYAFPFEVTADLPTAERLRLYSTSSCLFVTTRILVVDFLSGRLDPKMVSGLIILNAHKATESSGEGFAVRLYKSKGGEGYVRAFSDNPFSFNAEFAKVEKVMKAVHAQSLQIWPRFRTAVQDDFDGRAPEVGIFVNVLLHCCLSAVCTPIATTAMIPAKRLHLCRSSFFILFLVACGNIIATGSWS